MKSWRWLAALYLGASTASAQNAPNFYRATSVRGAIAYQSNTDKSQFFYLPTQTEALLGDRLRTFRVSYYGVGDPFYIQNGTTGSVASSVGAVVSATAAIGLDDQTRKRLLTQIQTDFGIQTPRLVPLPLTNAKIRSLLLESALSVANFGQIYSTNPAFEQEFAFSAGSRDNLFAQLLATSDNAATGAVQANPHFAVELVGETEFVGDPWKIQITCDLQQVWKQVRSAASASVSIGWFRLGEANYNSINQALQRSGACKYSETPGNLIDRDKNLLPLLEMTRKIFEQLNAEARGGQGFFKFEPNPEAPPVSASGAKSVWPWKVSVNLGYSSAHFTQSLTWSTEIQLQTRFNYPISATTAIAVTCGTSTRAFFQDLGNTTENCITQAKVDKLMQRLSNEKTVVNRKLNELERKLIDGTVSTEVYNILYKRWTTESQTEGAFVPIATFAAIHTDPRKRTDSLVVGGFKLSVPESIEAEIEWARNESSRRPPE